MKQQKSWKKLSIFAGITAAVLGAGILYYVLAPRGPIYDFDPARDTQKILAIFEHNWHWLISSKDYSPEFMLKHRAPSKDPLYVGSLHIKVLREQNKLAGFTAYYMKKKRLGQLLFLAVSQEFRGKGYGEQLVRYALKDLANMGASRVRLVTRTANFPAHRLYNRIGFYEVEHHEDGFVYFEYDVSSL